jgi:hypothetical protein
VTGNTGEAYASPGMYISLRTGTFRSRISPELWSNLAAKVGSILHRESLLRRISRRGLVRAACRLFDREVRQPRATDRPRRDPPPRQPSPRINRQATSASESNSVRLQAFTASASRAAPANVAS